MTPMSPFYYNDDQKIIKENIKKLDSQIILIIMHKLAARIYPQMALASSFSIQTLGGSSVPLILCQSQVSFYLL